MYELRDSSNQKIDEANSYLDANRKVTSDTVTIVKHTDAGEVEVWSR